uniref:Uncharacterized protein n=1 Tax=Caloglossa intermedia TaxID=100879 RepID=A0A1Z1M6J7_9FLOR|nr:hypothetical protein [Caloglossa intermedia]ARW61522.1 hypothetical protein [Caloglossa intermedia]
MFYIIIYIKSMNLYKKSVSIFSNEICICCRNMRIFLYLLFFLCLN